MNAILDLLHHRRSSKKFGELAPNEEQLTAILKAGLRAPDHGRLKPYHFVVVQKSAMPTLHQCLLSAVDEFQLSEVDRQKASNLVKAPLIIGVVAKIDHQSPKIPAWEQMITAGCASYAMQLAANAQGFDTVWISKKWVDGQAVRQQFGCEEGDKVVALLLIGSPLEGSQISRAKESEEISDFVHYLK